MVGQIYALLKADLITAEQSGWKQVSQELVLERDPQVIVAGKFSFEEINESAILKTTTAVKENKVVLPTRGSLSVAGPRLIDAIEELAEVLYPDLFP